MPTSPTRQRGVRTFAPRWRNSPLTEERMERLLPRHTIPEGPLVPEVAFGRVAPVVLEIGCGHGAAAIAYAAEHPRQDVLAVDVHVPGLARMMAAAERAGVTNLWVHNGDAIPLLEDRVRSGSLHAVHLFFPDPWPKTRHVKRRFVQQHTLSLIADRLEAGGVLRVATDQEPYARHTLHHLTEHGDFDIITGERPEWRPLDGFEAKGRRAGREIIDLTARRR